MQAKETSSEEIAVIGSGIAGSLTAFLLAKRGIKVLLIEERDDLFSGTSSGAIQAHLGGLYSGNLATAKECLSSAIKFKKALPFGLNDRRAWFLVAGISEVSVEGYLEFYESLKEHYGSLPISDQCFGSPSRFFRHLRPNEYEFASNIQGGIATQEPCLDVFNLRRMLLTQLRQLGVIFLLETEVTQVKRRGDRFVLVSARHGFAEEYAVDQVCNAGGYKSRLLDHQLGDRTEYVLALKTWNMVRHDAALALPPFYIVRGDLMHYSPVGGGGLASLIVASDEGSYLDTIRYGEDQPFFPDEWREILRSGDVPGKVARQNAVIAYATSMFLPGIHFEPIDLIPGVAVSFNSSRQDRTHRGVARIVPGWQTIIPTKFTNALELAEEATRHAITYAEKRASDD